MGLIAWSDGSGLQPSETYRTNVPDTHGDAMGRYSAGRWPLKLLHPAMARTQSCSGMAGRIQFMVSG